MRSLPLLLLAVAATAVAAAQPEEDLVYLRQIGSRPARFEILRRKPIALSAGVIAVPARSIRGIAAVDRYRETFTLLNVVQISGPPYPVRYEVRWFQQPLSTVAQPTPRPPPGWSPYRSRLEPSR